MRTRQRSLEILDQDCVADLIAARDVKLLAIAREGILVNVTFGESGERAGGRSVNGLHPNIRGISARYQINERPAVRRPFRCTPRVSEFIGLQRTDQSAIGTGDDPQSAAD